jgi:hypothetical protein
VKLQAACLFMAVLVGACVAPYTGTGVPPKTTSGKQADAKARPAETPSRAVVEPAISDADRIMTFFARVMPLKGTELASELEDSRAAFEEDRSVLHRVQLALLLSLPGASFRDDATALALLNVIVKDKGREGSDLRPLALWLHAHLMDLKRSDEALQQQSVKLKEEQRRAEALQQKLDAILDMEMKMIEREQNLPKKK